MKKHIVLLALNMLTLSCGIETTQHPGAAHQTTTTQNKTVQIVFIADRSKSFVTHYSHPAPELFHPLCDKIINSGSTLDFRIGFVFSNSDNVLDRYYVPYVPEEAAKSGGNPWLETQKKKAVAKQPTASWSDFAAAVNSKLAIPPTNSSDIASAIGHALLTFQEGKATRKILVLCTDGEDSRGQLPSVAQDIEVITVGLLPDNQIEQALNTTNMRKFENLHSAIDYLYSQTF